VQLLLVNGTGAAFFLPFVLRRRFPFASATSLLPYRRGELRRFSSPRLQKARDFSPPPESFYVHAWTDGWTSFFR